MVGLISRRRTPKHAKRHLEAAEPSQAADLPGLPEKFLPLLAHAETVARGGWVNPEHADMIRSLRAEYGVWEREQQRD